MIKTRGKINRSLTFNISTEKSLLDLLDSVEEDTPSYATYNNKVCECCKKVILKNKDIHQIKCFKDKIQELEVQLKLQKDNIKHEIHISGLELLIERNNEKWNRIMNK